MNNMKHSSIRLDQDHLTGQISCAPECWYCGSRSKCHHKCGSATRAEHGPAEQRQIPDHVPGGQCRECDQSRDFRALEGLHHFYEITKTQQN